MRGQPYQSLGATVDVTNPDGTVTESSYGGKSFVGAQIEARFGVTDSIDAVGFYDIGLVDVTSFPTSDANWHAGPGSASVTTRPSAPSGSTSPPRWATANPSRASISIGIGQTF